MIRRNVLIAGLGILLIVSCKDEYRPGPRGINTKVEEQTYQEVKKTAQEIKQELKEREWSSPAQFLSVKNGTYRKNLFGEFVLEGQIANSAEEATYKDIEIEIKYYTKTDTYLGSSKESIIEFFEPRKYKSFKLKVFGPKNSTQIGYKIVSAKAVINK